MSLAFIIISLLLPSAIPQQVSVNNNALFTLGLLTAVGGTAFLLGRNTAQDGQNL